MLLPPRIHIGNVGNDAAVLHQLQKPFKLIAFSDVFFSIVRIFFGIKYICISNKMCIDEFIYRKICIYIYIVYNVYEMYVCIASYSKNLQFVSVE